MRDQYDVVIVGGGMVGISLACLLDGLDLPRPAHVMLVESKPLKQQGKPQQPGFDVRTTALAYGTVDMFRKTGLWQELENFAEPIRSIEVTDQGRFGSVNLDASQHDVEALGYVVENHALGKVLNHYLHQGRTEVMDSTEVAGLQQAEDGIDVELRSSGAGVDDAVGHKVRAGLVVLADGGRSGLAEKVGIHRRQHDYAQTAVITNVSFSLAHHNRAYERFTASGPMALLPLEDFDGQHRAGLIWTRSAEQADELLTLPENEFLDRLQLEFGFGLGEFLRCGKRVSYPLSLLEAQEQVRPHLVLLGNVAHALHPVAGQGFNLGFRDTVRLTACIRDALAGDENPGQMNYLLQYLEAVRHDQDRTIHFSHGMTNLFSSEKPLDILTRKIGLFGLNLLPPVRKQLGVQAMGLAGKQLKPGIVSHDG